MINLKISLHRCVLNSHKCSTPILSEIVHVTLKSVAVVTSEHLRDLRDNILSLPKPKSTTYGLNLVRYIGPKLWNSIPNMFRIVTNFNSFKRSISQVDLVQFL